MIRRVVNSLYHRYNRCPVWGSGSPPATATFCGFAGQYRKPEGCLPVQGRTHTLSYPLVAFQSGKMFKRLGGGYASV